MQATFPALRCGRRSARHGTGPRTSSRGQGEGRAKSPRRPSEAGLTRTRYSHEPRYAPEACSDSGTPQPAETAIAGTDNSQYRGSAALLAVERARACVCARVCVSVCARARVCARVCLCVSARVSVV